MQKVREGDLQYRDGDSGVKYLMRGPQIDWGVILMLPGQTLGAHYHQQVEETFYVAEGRGVFEVNGEVIAVQAGDALRLEPTDQHDLRNDSDAPLKLIFIKSPYVPQDKVNL